MEQATSGDRVFHGPAMPSGQQFKISYGDQHATVSRSRRWTAAI